MKTGTASGILLICAAWAQSAAAAQVLVTITGVRDSRGVVRVAICPRTEFLHPHCPYVGHAPSAAGAVRVLIDGVPPGVYAAQAYQDANSNGILDRSWLDLPKEGMGFSNDALMHFGPPAFSDAAFNLGVDDAAIHSVCAISPRDRGEHYQTGSRIRRQLTFDNKKTPARHLLQTVLGWAPRNDTQDYWTRRHDGLLRVRLLEQFKDRT